MQGGRILLGNELGAGVSYSIHCLELARSLSQHGHRPVVALRHVDVVSRLSPEPAIRVVQAPYVVGRPDARARLSGFRPTSFADLMACNGFGSEDHLYPMLRAWRDLIDIVRPDLVIGTYAPLLATAAFGRIPVVLFGPGYCTPPADGDAFPAFRPGARPHADPERLLDVVRSVQARFGAPLPTRLTDVYRGRRRLVTTFPELDPYRACRRDPCVGHFEALEPPRPASGDCFYAYLAGAGRAPRRVLRALAASGLPGRVHVRDAAGARWADLPRERIEILAEPPPLERAVRDAALVVHHGGLATAQAALAAGRPQVIVPQVVDQVLVAEALAGVPYVRGLRGAATASAIADAVLSLRACREAPAAAMRHARSIRERGLHDGKRTILEAALTALEAG